MRKEREINDKIVVERSNLLDLFGLLFEVDKRNNPDLYEANLEKVTNINK